MLAKKKTQKTTTLVLFKNSKSMVCVSILFTRFAKGNSMAMKFINEAAFDSM